MIINAKSYFSNSSKVIPLADLMGGGASGTRASWGGPNSFIFMQISAKNVQNNPNLGVGAPPRENPRSATAYSHRAFAAVSVLALKLPFTIGRCRGPIFRHHCKRHSVWTRQLRCVASFVNCERQLCRWRWRLVWIGHYTLFADPPLGPISLIFMHSGKILDPPLHVVP